MAAIPEAPRAGRWALMFFSAALLSTGALARGSPSTTAAPPKPAAKSRANTPTKAKVLLLVEQRALDLIKAASARGCAAAAGAVVGVAIGAAVASSNTAAAISSAYSAGVAAGSASTGAACSSGYAAGAVAAAAPPPGATTTTVTTTTTTYETGVHYAALAPGAMAINKNGTAYYLSGNTWFQPVYGANGVYYTVVAAA